MGARIISIILTYIVLFGNMRSKIQYPCMAEETLSHQNPNNKRPRKKMHNHQTQNFLLGWVLAICHVRQLHLGFD